MSPSKEKPRVLLTGEIDWAQDEWYALSDVATLEVAPLFLGEKSRLNKILGCRRKKSSRIYQRS